MNPGEDAGWKSGASGGSQLPQHWRQMAGATGKGQSGMPLKIQRAILAALAICLGGLILYLISNLVIDSVPPVRIVTVGIGDYRFRGIPLNPNGDTDAAAFQTLQDPPNVVVESLQNRLEGTVLSRELAHELHDKNLLDGKNLIVFCNLYGIVRSDSDNPAGYFLAIDCEADHCDGTTPPTLLSIREFFDILKASPAKHLLALVDIRCLGPDWRLGVLADQFAEQFMVEAQQACEEMPSLQVICSCSPGQRSWNSNEWDAGQSVFTHFVLEGLKRAADGHKGPSDGRVQCDELYRYVAHNVDAWSKLHRGLPQTVARIASRPRDYDLMQVRQTATNSEPSSDSAPAESEDVDATETEGEDTKEASDAETDTASDADTKTANDTKDKVGSEEKKSESNAQSDKPDSDAKSKTESNGEDSTSDEAPDEDKMDPAEQQKQEYATAMQTLAECWKVRDDLRRDMNAALNAPHQWRMLQADLIRNERRLRHHASPELEWSFLPEQRPDDADTPTQIRAAFDPPSWIEASQLAKLSIGSPLFEAPHEDLTGENQEAFAAALKAVLATDAEKAPTEAVRRQFTILIQSIPALQHELYREILKRADALPVNSPSALAQSIRALMTLFQFVPREADQPMPSGFARIEQLVTRLSSSSEATQMPAAASVNIAAIRLVLRAERASWQDPQFYPYVSRPLGNAFAALHAAEQWLAVSRTDEAHQWLETAQRELDRRDRTDQAVRRALQLRSQLLAELPGFARWAANAEPQQDWDEATYIAWLADWATQLSDPSATVPPALPRDLLTGLDERGQDVLELIYRVNQFDAVLERPEPGTSDATERWTESLADWTQKTASLWSRVQDRLQKQLNELLAKQDAFSDDWRAAEQLLSLPWIGWPERERLLSLLESPPRTSTRLLEDDASTSRDTTQPIRGLRQGFWAVHVLALSGMDVRPLWRMWGESIQEWHDYTIDFADEADTTAAEEARAAVRLRLAMLGEAINRHWQHVRNARLESADQRKLPETARQRLQQICLRLADGTDDVSQSQLDLMNRLRTEQGLALLSFRQQQWQSESIELQSQQKAADRVKLLQSLASRCETLRNQLAASLNVKTPPMASRNESLPVATLRGLPDLLDLSWKDQPTAELTVPISTVRPIIDHVDRPQVQLSFHGQDIQVRRGGQSIGDGDAVTLTKPSQSFRYDVALSASATTSARMLTVALLDPRNGRPIEIRQITVNPPIQRDAWHIVFVTPREETADDIAAMGLRRHFPSRTAFQLPIVGGTELHLPALGQAEPASIPLKPYLLRPATDVTPSAQVSVFSITPDGDRRLLFEPLDVTLGVNGQPTPLTFASKKNPAPPATPADPSKPATPVVPVTEDISRGLVFRIVPQGKPALEYVIQPRLRPESRFIMPPARPQFDSIHHRLTIAVDRLSKDDVHDPLLRVPIPVRLELHPESLLQATEATELIEPALDIAGGPNRREFRVTFRKDALMALKGERLYVSLSVAGLAHTHRWQMMYQGGRWNVRPVPDRHAARSTEQNLVLITQPANGVLLKEGDPLVVKAEVDAPLLDSQEEATTWTLEFRMRPVDAEFDTVPPKRQEVRASLDKIVSVQGIEEGLWQFVSSASDYQHAFKTVGRTGHFQVTVRLLDGANHVMSEDTIELGIDSETSAPDMPQISGVPEMMRLDGTPLQFQTVVRDAQSGISEVACGFDFAPPGALADGVLADKEVATVYKVAKKDQLTFTKEQIVSLTIPADKLPMTKGQYHLLVTAKNGLGVACTRAAVVTLDLRPPTGTLTVVFENLGPRQATGGTVVVLNETGQAIAQKLFNRKTQVVVFDDLVEGTYSVRVIRGSKTVNPPPTGVTASEPATIHIDASRL